MILTSPIAAKGHLWGERGLRLALSDEQRDAAKGEHGGR